MTSNNSKERKDRDYSNIEYLKTKRIPIEICFIGKDPGRRKIKIKAIKIIRDFAGAAND